MRKVDFKKLAIIGIASGALMASQAGDAAESSNSSSSDGVHLEGSRCGGAGQCGGKGGRNGCNYAQNSSKKRQRVEGTYHLRPKQWMMSEGNNNYRGA